MSKERDMHGFGEAYRMVAMVFLGFMTTFYPENTGPGRWAAAEKKKMKRNN